MLKSLKEEEKNKMSEIINECYGSYPISLEEQEENIRELRCLFELPPSNKADSACNSYSVVSGIVISYSVVKDL